MKNNRESLPEMVSRRNKRLLALFTKCEIPIRIVGDPSNPTIIYKEEVALSAFVHNFSLHFTDKPFEGKVIKTIPLEKDTLVDRSEIVFVLERYPQRKITKVALTGTDLWLVGYNYVYPEEKLERYPVFAKHRAKIYFREEIARERAAKLEELGYDVSLK